MLKSKKQPIKEIRRFSAALKRKVVEEVLTGGLTPREAAGLYGISSARTVNAWIFAHEGRRTRVVRVMMKREADRKKKFCKTTYSRHSYAVAPTVYGR